MENLVGPDNRLKVELREPLLDTTGFKQLRVSNIEGDILDISFRRTIRVPESGNRLKVPPDLGPFPIYPVDGYKDKFDQSICTKDGVFIPVYQREAMWIHFESNGFFAVKVIVDGVNAVSGELSTESLSVDLRRIALLYEKSSIQDYILAGTLGQRCLDGVKIKGDKIMQFVAAPTPNQTVISSIKSSIKATDGIRGIRFEIVPLELDSIKRIPITVQMLSGKVIRINVSLETVVDALIEKIHGITGIPKDEQRIFFAGYQLERHHYLTSYGVMAGSQLFLALSSASGPKSHAAQKYMPQTAAQKRLLEHHVAIKESYGEKRDVMFADTNTNIVQDIEVDDFYAEDWDTENTLIFNLQMISAPSSEIVLGMKPPPCPISTAVCKEYHCPLLSVHNDDEEKNKDSRDKDEDENGREVFKVTTDQSGTSGSFAPVGEMKERLREIFKLPDDAT
ncbi:hypothetical protein EAF00_011375 [Botryotinia globosa]|nr:hypothetical protein EAF00_011375 [Botryotinia globosa]